NPERPWPQIDSLAEHTAAAGFTLAERLTIYPEYVRRGEPWLDPRLRAHVDALAHPDSWLAVEGRVPSGKPWQEPDVALVETGRPALFAAIDSEGRTADRRDDFDSVYGDWDELRASLGPREVVSHTRQDFRTALRHAESDPAGLSDADALALLSAEPGA